MKERDQLYRALATLSYAIAKCDGVLHHVERETFKQTIAEELGDDYWIAESRFELLENETTPSIDTAYNQVMFTIKQNKEIFTPELKSKFIAVIGRIADAYKGTSEVEDFIIRRFKSDLRELGL